MTLFFLEHYNALQGCTRDNIFVYSSGKALCEDDFLNSSFDLASDILVHAKQVYNYYNPWLYILQG